MQLQSWGILQVFVALITKCVQGAQTCPSNFSHYGVKRNFLFLYDMNLALL